MQKLSGWQISAVQWVKGMLAVLRWALPEPDGNTGVPVVRAWPLPERKQSGSVQSLPDW